MTMARTPTSAPPGRHPPAELLLDHVGGAGSDAESLIIATHLEMCPECRAGMRDCAAIGGALLDAIEPVRLPPNLLNRTLEAIESGRGVAESERRMGRPPALATEAGPWRKLPGGVNVRRLPIARAPERLMLMRIRPGGSVFRHRHIGDEWTLVLQGGFSDRSGHFATGDFVLMGPEDEHKPIADSGEDCICLVLLRDRLRYSGLLSRVAAAVLKL